MQRALVPPAEHKLFGLRLLIRNLEGHAHFVPVHSLHLGTPYVPKCYLAESVCSGCSLRRWRHPDDIGLRLTSIEAWIDFVAIVFVDQIVSVALQSVSDALRLPCLSPVLKGSQIAEPRAGVGLAFLRSFLWGEESTST